MNAWPSWVSNVKRLYACYSVHWWYDWHMWTTFADDDKEEKKDEVSEKKGKYAKFWKEFGKAIKLGIIEDTSNRVRLAKLLRFHRYYAYFDCVFAECGLLLYSNMYILSILVAWIIENSCYCFEWFSTMILWFFLSLIHSEYLTFRILFSLWCAVPSQATNWLHWISTSHEWNQARSKSTTSLVRTGNCWSSLHLWRNCWRRATK